MNRETLLAYTKNAFTQMQALLEKKNADYAGQQENYESNAFANFLLVERMGLCRAEVGVLTRMSDKMARITKFINRGEFQVNDESIKDTLRDLANYSVLLEALIHWKQECAKESGK